MSYNGIIISVTINSSKTTRLQVTKLGRRSKYLPTLTLKISPLVCW